MSTNAASALAGKAEPAVVAGEGETQTPEQIATNATANAEALAAKPWYEDIGVEPRFADTIKAKGWSNPNDILDSYTSVEKLVSLERGGDVDRILVKPKDDALPLRKTRRR